MFRLDLVYFILNFLKLHFRSGRYSLFKPWPDFPLVILNWQKLPRGLSPHKTCREMQWTALMRFGMKVDELFQLNWIYITVLLQLLLLQQQSRVQWAEKRERSKSPCCFYGFLPRGSWEKSNLAINLIWSGSPDLQIHPGQIKDAGNAVWQCYRFPQETSKRPW